MPTSKPLSASAAVRAAKAAQIAAANPVISDELDFSGVPDEVRDTMLTYHPKGAGKLWDELRHLTIVLTLAYGVPSVNVAHQILRVSFDFLKWYKFSAYRHYEGPITLVELGDLQPNIADTWAASTNIYSPAGKPTARARIRRILKNIHTQPPVILPRPPRNTLPYTPNQIEKLRQMVSVQPSEFHQRTGALTFSLAYGFGLDGYEQKHLKYSDFDFTGPIPTVTVPNSKVRLARTIPIRADAIDLLEKGFDLLAKNPWHKGDDGYIFRQFDDSIPSAIRRLVNLTGIDYNIYRLRCTWLLALMASGLRFEHLMYLSGVSTPAALVELTPFLPGDIELDLNFISNVPLVRPVAR